MGAGSGEETMEEANEEEKGYIQAHNYFVNLFLFLFIPYKI
jgi:hypothetical protein